MGVTMNEQNKNIVETENRVETVADSDYKEGEPDFDNPFTTYDHTWDEIYKDLPDSEINVSAYIIIGVLCFILGCFIFLFLNSGIIEFLCGSLFFALFGTFCFWLWRTFFC